MGLRMHICVYDGFYYKNQVIWENDCKNCLGLFKNILLSSILIKGLDSRRQHINARCLSDIIRLYSIIKRLVVFLFERNFIKAFTNVIYTP